MTCSEAVSRLDDLADNELTAAQAVQVREHINQCDACRREYQQIRQFKQLLKGAGAPDPGDTYFQKTTSTILHRTVAVDNAAASPVADHRVKQQERRAFVRALLSAAASLVILFAAILLGSAENRLTASGPTDRAPVLATPGIRNTVRDEIPVFTVKDRERLARGRMLIGSPGLLGRFAGLPEIMLSIDME